MILSNAVRAVLNKAFLAAYPDVGESFSCALSRATQPKFGHFQCNSAMALAKQQGCAPRVIADAVLAVCTFGSDDDLIEKMEVAGPGFINIWLNPRCLSQLLNEMQQDPHCGVQQRDRDCRVVIDFSSPNVAKEMHVGHLRSTIIGDCLARVFEYVGYDVLRLNHVGDWGTAFGMLIAYLQQHQPSCLPQQDTASDHAEQVSAYTCDKKATLADLMGWYRASKVIFDEDESFKQRARECVVELQAGQPDVVAAWQMICDISYQAYHDIYRLLGVTITDRGESFYNPWLADIVKVLDGKGILEISDGAACVFLEGFSNKQGQPLPFMIRKSDGGYNYATTDLAALRHRVEQEHADRIIYVTDAGQSMHFDMLFSTAQKAGFVDIAKVRLDHVPFGLVLGEDGKKFRTRSGDVERLVDLLQAAIDKAYAILEQREIGWPEDELQHAAKVLGMGAVKYADLSCHRQHDYKFSYDKMLQFEGNTAAFILYSYVRIRSIQRKVYQSDTLPDGFDAIDVNQPTEIALGLHLLQFADVCETVINDLLPHRLTDYLYECATLFNAFFRDCRVEGVEQQGARCALIQLTATVIHTGLQLLGIETLARM